MNCWTLMTILVIVAGVVSGILISERWVKKPLVIEFPYTPSDWVTPILFGFAAVIVFFVVELCLALVVCDNFIAVYKVEDMGMKALENGLLIPILCAFVSKIFGKAVEAQNLDYLQLYNEKVSKICFSVLVLSFCVVMVIRCFVYGNQEDSFYHYLMNRILMWALSVLGTWVGFGFGCKGRIEKENEKINNANRNISAENKWKFWGPILIWLILCDLVMVLTFNKKATQIVFIILIGIMVGIFTLIIWATFVKKYRLSIGKSLNSFLKARKQYEATGIGRGQYGRMHYRIENNALIIDEMNVIYKGHQENKDFQKLFGKITIPFKKPDEVFKVLEKRHNEQAAYVKKGYEDCIEAEHIKKRTKIK